MIIVKLMGGLGNQMFQYAFGKYLAEKHNTELKLDTSFLLDRKVKTKGYVFRDYNLDIFNLSATFAKQKEVKKMCCYSNNSLLNKIITKTIGPHMSRVIETDMSFMSGAFNSGDNVYLEGYWQSEKYFKPIKQSIEKEFTFKNLMPDFIELLASEIVSKNAVSINVRRGDFLTSKTHGICNIDYYYEAERIIIEKHPDAFFYVFSDDINWCVNNLKFTTPTYFVQHQQKTNTSEWDFYLITRCKHFIIANSSFAWWAAYLAENKNKIVIAPGKWVQDSSLYNADIYPQGWLTIN